jgi:hypothetical protein
VQLFLRKCLAVVALSCWVTPHGEHVSGSPRHQTMQKVMFTNVLRNSQAARLAKDVRTLMIRVLQV